MIKSVYRRAVHKTERGRDRQREREVEEERGREKGREKGRERQSEREREPEGDIGRGRERQRVGHRRVSFFIWVPGPGTQ